MTRTASLLLNVEMKFLIRQVLHIIQSRRTIRFHISPYPTMQIFSGATGGHPVEDRTCSAWLGQRSPHHSRPQTHGSMECSLRMSCEHCRVCWTRGLARSALRPQKPARSTKGACVSKPACTSALWYRGDCIIRKCDRTCSRRPLAYW